MIRILLLLLALSCASDSVKLGGPEILEALPEDRKSPEAENFDPTKPLIFPLRGESYDELAYQLFVESNGNREEQTSEDMRAPDPSRNFSHLELEYRSLPVTTAEVTGEQLILDGLHYKMITEGPNSSREIELGSDRLRLFADGEQIADIEGNPPRRPITPRKMLYRSFALLGFAPSGEVNSYQIQGQRVSRDFIKDIPIQMAILYANVGLPERGVVPGDRWSSKRFPPDLTGAAGLSIEINHTFAGYEDINGVRCAWLLLDGERNAEDVRTHVGMAFDRVVGKFGGEAWIDVKTSRVLKLVSENTFRTAYKKGKPPGKVSVNRLRFRTKLTLETRDPGDVPGKWKDGQERFGTRGK